MKKHFALVLAVTIMLSTVLAPNAYAAAGTAVQVSPHRLSDDSASPGSMRTFTVDVSKASNMAGYGLVVRYKPDVLQVASANPGPVFAAAVDSGSGFYFSDIQNDQGLLQVAFTFVGSSFSSQGSAPLVGIDFQVMSVGFSWVLLESVLLVDPNGEAFADVAVSSGYFENDPALPATPMIADLGERKAWPEARKFSISQEADPEVTFFAHVVNSAPVTMVVRVRFTVVGEAFGPTTFESSLAVLDPGAESTLFTGPLLSFNAASAGPGKYFVSAQAFFADDGINFLPGINQKTFSFGVSA